MEYPINNTDEVKHWLRIEAFKSVSQVISGNPDSDRYGDSVGEVKIIAPQSINESNSQSYDVIDQMLLGSVSQGLGGVFNRFESPNMTGGLMNIAEAMGVPGAKMTAGALRSAANPQKEKFYTAPNFRSHSFSWEFAPHDAGEAQALDEIIKFLTKQSYPERDGATRFIYPSEFKITHVVNTGGEFEGFNKYAKTVLTDISVNYSGAGVAQSFSGGGAAFVKLQTTFTETNLLHKNHEALS